MNPRLFSPRRRRYASAIVAGESSPSAPTVIDSALTPQKETEGTASYVATLATSAAGLTILSWDGVRTAISAGALAGNNGNSYTQVFNQPYGNGFTNYHLKGFRAYNVAGGSNHTVTGTKSSSTAEEATVAALALSGGTLVASSNVVQRVAAGAGATHTSGIVTTTGPALLVAVCSGDGNVNATAPTQTWPVGWNIEKSVAYSSAQAPNGHIPLYVATREVSVAGDYTVGVQVTIDEGVTLWIGAVQL